MPGVWTGEREAAAASRDGEFVLLVEQLMASVFMCGVEDLLFSGSRFVWTVTVAALRRWYAARLRACRQALRAWCGLRDVYQVKTPQLSLQVLFKENKKGIVPPDGHVLSHLADS